MRYGLIAVIADVFKAACCRIATVDKSFAIFTRMWLFGVRSLGGLHRYSD